MLGNGSLLATVSGRGRIQRLWWPHPDRGQHLGELRLGIERDGTTLWLDDEPFAWSQSYADGALILRTTARVPGLEVEVNDLVHPSEAAVVRRISCATRGGRLVVRCRPELDERTRALGAYVDSETGALTFHRGRYALALQTSAEAQATAEGIGRVEGTVSCAFDAPVELVCGFGSSPRDAIQRTRAVLAEGFERIAERRRRQDAARLTESSFPENGPLAALYNRSLLVFDVLADRATGAVVAAPELDPDFVDSGGYGFVWARDLAFLVLAFLASGRRSLAQGALRWLPAAQEPDGLWLQRHWSDGSLAPSWCAHQLDETGSVLFAYEAAWRALRDDELDSRLWPSACRAADFLLGSINAQGLPHETADLWEERDGCHSYTAAATVGGLRAAASFARRHEPELTETYSGAAEELAAALDRCFWSDEHGRYLRTLGDPAVDVSLLGLAWPFRAVDPAGERMRATADAVANVLGRPGGGLPRYEGDRYAGGNSWILAALWLGLYRRQTGDRDGHRRALEYAQRVATPLGLLPEQVTDDGMPAWVVPLAWSHAMLVLAARPELEVVQSLPGAAQSPVRVTN